MANLLRELPESCKSDYKTFEEVFLTKPSNSKPVVWRDHVFLPGVDPKTVEYALEHHEPKDNEILIVSFPKTGTTWTAEIVRQLLYGNNERLDLITKDLTQAILYLESGEPSKYNVLRNLPIPRTYYATHLPIQLVNVEKYKSKNMKFIYLLRNPKDSIVSLFHFIKKFPNIDKIVKDPDDWDEFFEVLFEAQLPHCMKKGEGYMEHILGWLPFIKDNDNAIIVVYEDMMRNPQKEVKRIADFLELDRTEAEILEVCEKTKFTKMKKLDAESSSAGGQSRTKVNMLRKGMIGDWKNYFNAEQSARVDAATEKKLKGTGIKFTYE